MGSEGNATASPSNLSLTLYRVTRTCLRAEWHRATLSNTCRPINTEAHLFTNFHSVAARQINRVMSQSHHWRWSFAAVGISTKGDRPPYSTTVLRKSPNSIALDSCVRQT